MYPTLRTKPSRSAPARSTLYTRFILAGTLKQSGRGGPWQASATSPSPLSRSIITPVVASIMLKSPMLLPLASRRYFQLRPVKAPRANRTPGCADTHVLPASPTPSPVRPRAALRATDKETGVRRGGHALVATRTPHREGERPRHGRRGHREVVGGPDHLAVERRLPESGDLSSTVGADQVRAELVTEVDTVTDRAGWTRCRDPRR